jgi:hypothetical protein
MSEKRANPELSSAATDQLLRLLAATALGGAGIRTGLSVLRNANPRYEPPEAPKPMIVDLPYPAREAPPVAAVPLSGKEKKAPPVKAANELLDRLSNFRLSDLIPTYTPPTGVPGETDPNKVPLMGTAKVLAAAAGLGGGYFGAQKVLDAAERWGAKKELAEAKRQYQEAILGDLSRSSLPTKRAAEASTPAQLAGMVEAVNELYATVKAAEGPSLSRAVASALWPGLIGDSELAGQANGALIGGMGLLGGYLGYNKWRDAEGRQRLRKAIEAVDRANASNLPRPVVARLVPVKA